jgi:hypothetical protein
MRDYLSPPKSRLRTLGSYALVAIAIFGVFRVVLAAFAARQMLRQTGVDLGGFMAAWADPSPSLNYSGDFVITGRHLEQVWKWLTLTIIALGFSVGVKIVVAHFFTRPRPFLLHRRS